MSFQYIAFRFVQPRDYNQLVTDLHSQQCLGEARFDLEPRVGRAFRSLPRRVFPTLDCRSHKANRLERIRLHLWNGFHRLPDVMHLSTNESSFQTLSHLSRRLLAKTFGVALREGG